MTDDIYETDGEPDVYAPSDDEQGPVQYRATRRVNVRSRANLDAPVVRVLEAGTTVPVAAIEAGWAELDVDGKELVKAEFLEES